MTLGTCSICGGPVTFPQYQIHTVPTCEWCGATKAQPYGPVIPMVKRIEWETMERNILKRIQNNDDAHWREIYQLNPKE